MTAPAPDSALSLQINFMGDPFFAMTHVTWVSSCLQVVLPTVLELDGRHPLQGGLA
jgi:hypothetical protein